MTTRHALERDADREQHAVADHQQRPPRRSACPAASVRYPATSTSTAAARMIRLRRVSRKRRAARAPPAEVTEGRELGIRHGGYHRSRVGSSSGPSSAFGLHVPALVQRGAPDPVGPAAAADQPAPAGRPPPASRRRRSASCPGCSAAGRARCHSCSNRPRVRPVVASTAASKSSPASSRCRSGVSVPVGFRRASSVTAEAASA